MRSRPRPLRPPLPIKRRPPVPPLPRRRICLQRRRQSSLRRPQWRSMPPRQSGKQPWPPHRVAEEAHLSPTLHDGHVAVHSLQEPGCLLRPEIDLPVMGRGPEQQRPPRLNQICHSVHAQRRTALATRCQLATARRAAGGPAYPRAHKEALGVALGTAGSRAGTPGTDAAEQAEAHGVLQRCRAALERAGRGAATPRGREPCPRADGRAKP